MIRGVKSQIDLSFLTKEEMSMSIKSTFAREIYHARSERSLTQEQVADIVSISVRWYQQSKRFSVAWVDCIAEVNGLFRLRCGNF